MGKNKMIFELVDNTRMNEFNESCKMEKIWYSPNDNGCEEIMPIEDYYVMCKEFAAALGFSEDTIEKWFGEY